jgi:hypothetical protein
MENTKTLMIKVNNELHVQFKIACAKRQQTQKEAINELMKYYADQE